MYEVKVVSHFSAAHHLEGYRGGCEAQHGHNWEVEISIRGTALDEIGMLVDFREMKSVLSKELDAMDHKDLNTLEIFKGINPTSEKIAEYLFHALSKSLNKGVSHVSCVSVQETPGAKASYWNEDAT